jgi:polysaccharide biosynthesis/export protein
MRRIVRAMLAAVVAVPLALAQLAPLPAHAQSASYRIQPGDQLAITVLEDDTLNRQVLVLPDGRISVPLAGSVRASGQTVESVEKAIADRLASNFAVRPSVFVSVTGVIEEEETFPIYVLGQVGAPGQVEVEVGTTLLQAVALSGGLDRFAATKRIQLRRTDASTGQERLYLFNFKAVERGAAIQSMITLREGDVLIVPERNLFE